jgi:hypothetical protein
MQLELDRLLAESHAVERACGGCTVCCTVLAETELEKPMRCACRHQGQAGCTIYEARPRACREFHCLWLRGVLPADLAYRPDSLGVLFDAYHPGERTPLRVAALEAWQGALDNPIVATLIDALAATTPVEVCNRDGDWQTRGD